MRILGIDPGTGILGFGVIDAAHGKATLVDAGVIRTPAKENDSVRLKTIFDELTVIIDDTNPTEMSVEKLFFAQNVTTAMTVAQARGVVLLCGMQAGLNIFEYKSLSPFRFHGCLPVQFAVHRDCVPIFRMRVVAVSLRPFRRP